MDLVHTVWTVNDQYIHQDVIDGSHCTYWKLFLQYSAMQSITIRLEHGRMVTLNFYWNFGKKQHKILSSEHNKHERTLVKVT